MRFADVNWKDYIHLDDPFRYRPITETYQYYYLKQIRISEHLEHEISIRPRRKKKTTSADSARVRERDGKKESEKEPETRRTGPLRFLKRYK